MSKILLNDCSEKVTETLSTLFGKSAQIVSAPFQENRDISKFDLVALYSESMDGNTTEKIKHLRFSTKFRNIPIVLLQPEKAPRSSRPFFSSGATETLALSEPPEALIQIFQSLMIPGRKPREGEMEYLSPFISSTKDVFSTMASMDVDFKQVYFQNEHRMLGDISGVIGLSGYAEGTVVITLYWDLAQQVISSIMGVTAEEISPELLNDGVGEIINMISGSAKRYLTDTSFYFQLSLPTVIIGWQHEIGHPDSSTVAVLIFDYEDKSFAVQVSLTPGKGDNNKL
jgi:chemotaxis protein CheX